MNEVAERPTRRGVYILPNLLTTGSLFAAFVGLLWALEGRFEWCAAAILASCLFDGLDGKVARLTGSTSEFGVQFDSLADVVAFGVTPAIMVHEWMLSSYGRLGVMASFLLVACGALRLARFNVQASNTTKGCNKYFVGLPIPAAGCTLASFVFFVSWLRQSSIAIPEQYISGFCLAMVFVLAFMMVSRVRFFSFKDFGIIKAHPFSTMVSVLLLFVLIASQPAVLGFALFLGYLLSGPIRAYIILPCRKLLRGLTSELS